VGKLQELWIEVKKILKKVALSFRMANFNQKHGTIAYGGGGAAGLLGLKPNTLAARLK